MASTERAGGFVARLAGFCDLLRSRGVSVGMDAELDAGRCVSHIRALRREDFYLACRTALVKRPEDLDAFDEAFADYWRGAADPHGPRPRDAGAPTPREGPSEEAPGEWGTPSGQEGDGPPRDRVQLLLYSPAGTPGDHALEPLPREALGTAIRVARRFRRWAATVPGRRYGPGHGGRIDFRRTVRSSLRSGGEWVALRRRQRKNARARFVVLWDTSGSMQGHGSLVLGVVYGLLRAEPSTQVVAFSTELEVLTPHLRGRPYREVLSEAARRLARKGTGTRIGRCLAEFNRLHGRMVDGRTTVLIVSDGWDLGDLDLLERELRILRRRAHLLLWVNPYADRPDFQPEVAGMKRALPHVDRLMPPAALAERGMYRAHFGPGGT